jgi:hypothetical protein
MLNGVTGYFSFITGNFQAAFQFCPIKLFSVSIGFYNRNRRFNDVFIGGKPMMAIQTFPAPPNGFAFLGRPGVDDLNVS